MKVGIVGKTGSVGAVLSDLIEKKEPAWQILSLSEKEKTLTESEIYKCSLIFFCSSAELSLKWIPLCTALKIPCVDLSSAFRKEPLIPLVIPEINGHLLSIKPLIVASPNCVATLLAMALFPLMAHSAIKRVILSSYQAASGAGYKGLMELERSAVAAIENKPFTPEIFPQPLAMNLFLHESALLETGYSEEEEKVGSETRKILNLDQLQISATCVRVPVKRAHSLSVNVEFENPLSAETALQLLASFPGICLKKGITPLFAAEKEEIFIGRVRAEEKAPNNLELWIVGDQLLKGAALNALQIAQALIA